MSAREPLAVAPRPQARARAGTTLETAMDPPAESRRAKAHCGFCGQPWFGDVTYCPYCGRQSASAPTGTGAHADALPAATLPSAVTQEPGSATSASAFASAADEPAAARADAPGSRWNALRKPILTAAAALAFVTIAIAVKELAGTPAPAPSPAPARTPAIAPKTAPVTAAVTAPVAPKRGASASTAQARRAEPVVPRADRVPARQPPAPAPPAPHRSLCSAANEAAGLCKPQ